MKKFFGKVESFFKKVFGSSKWEKTASTTLLIVTPLITTLLTLTAGPAVAAAAAAVLATVQKDLAAAAVILDDMDQAGTSATGSAALVVNILNSVKANLTSILTIAEVKNSGKISEVTQIVNTITAEIDAIVGAAPAS